MNKSNNKSKGYTISTTSLVRGGQYGHQFSDGTIKSLNEVLTQKIIRQARNQRQKNGLLNFSDGDEQKGVRLRGLCISIGWDIALPLLLVVIFGNFLKRYEVYNSDIRYGLNLLIFGIIVGIYNVAKDIRRELIYYDQYRVKQDKTKQNK